VWSAKVISAKESFYLGKVVKNPKQRKDIWLHRLYRLFSL